MGGKVRFVIAGLDPAIHPPSDFLAKKMDARVISAFTRVFNALLPAHDGPHDGEHRAWRDRTACPI
jgi:hypothetical protein